MDRASGFDAEGRGENPSVYELQATLKKRVWRDSNPRPSGPEPDALSTELHTHTFINVAYS